MPYTWENLLKINEEDKPDWDVFIVWVNIGIWIIVFWIWTHILFLKIIQFFI